MTGKLSPEDWARKLAKIACFFFNHGMSKKAFLLYHQVRLLAKFIIVSRPMPFCNEPASSNDLAKQQYPLDGYANKPEY